MKIQRYLPQNQLINAIDRNIQIFSIVSPQNRPLLQFQWLCSWFKILVVNQTAVSVRDTCNKSLVRLKTTWKQSLQTPFHSIFSDIWEKSKVFTLKEFQPFFKHLSLTRENNISNLMRNFKILFFHRISLKQSVLLKQIEEDEEKFLP